MNLETDYLIITVSLSLWDISGIASVNSIWISSSSIVKSCVQKFSNVRCVNGWNLSEAFNTMWRQCPSGHKCVWVDRKIKSGRTSGMHEEEAGCMLTSRRQEDSASSRNFNGETGIYLQWGNMFSANSVHSPLFPLGAQYYRSGHVYTVTAARKLARSSSKFDDLTTQVATKSTH